MNCAGGGGGGETPKKTYKGYMDIVWNNTLLSADVNVILGTPSDQILSMPFIQETRVNSTYLTMNIFTVATAEPSDMKFHVRTIAQLFP